MPKSKDYEFFLSAESSVFTSSYNIFYIAYYIMINRQAVGVIERMRSRRPQRRRYGAIPGFRFFMDHGYFVL